MICSIAGIPRSARRAFGQSGFTLIEIMMVLAVVVILTVLLFPVSLSVRASARNAGCISNLRALNQVFNAYAADNNSCFPPSRNDGVPWSLLVQDYLPEYPGLQGTQKKGITYCPTTSMDNTDTDANGRAIFRRDAAGWRTDYNVNPNVFFTDKDANTRDSMKSSMVFLFDGSGGVNLSISYNRHDAKFNVLFVGGNVEPYTSLTELKGRWAK